MRLGGYGKRRKREAGRPAQGGLFASKGGFSKIEENRKIKLLSPLTAEFVPDQWSDDDVQDLNGRELKLWLAEVGRERIEEIIDPELTIDRAFDTYLKKGYSREWINQRLQAIQVRKELTDEWQDRGVQKGVEFAILTDEITRAWSGMTTRQYKKLKGLKKENLRDNMTTLEIVLNKELTAQQNSNTIYIQREAVNMPVIRPIRELQNTTEISHFAKTLNEPIFITKNGRNDLVLMNDAVYERIMAQNEMYRKLAAAEAEVADGAELLDGMEVLKELRGKYGK